TGANTVDPVFTGGDGVAVSPSSWTEIANLLYIDARNAGFSYSIGDPKTGFGIRNFNPFIDGADFIRVLLRFFDAHESLRKNPVMIVGESYGGVRSSVMLNVLLNYRRYAGVSDLYRDDALAGEIQRHLERVFDAGAGVELSPETVARQFGRQVLVQPYLFGDMQDDVSGKLFEAPGSPIYTIAAETGRPYATCAQKAEKDCDPKGNALTFVSAAGRDYYKYDEVRNWVNDRIDRSVVPVMSSTYGYKALLDSSPFEIPMMYASQRMNGYKVTSEPVQTGANAQKRRWLAYSHRRQLAMQAGLTGFESAFGVLDRDDAYFVSCNDPVFYTFNSDGQGAVSYSGALYGRMFLENLLYVKTLTTNAPHDLICYPAAVPQSAARYPEVISVDPGDSEFTVRFIDGAFGMTSGQVTRTVAFPYYGLSGHPVEMSQSVKFLDDVKLWMLK
ncbi:MAG: hypothetical protein WC889_09360, partial [Myxococcota bacterium]